jgi:hypothetical protein
VEVQKLTIQLELSIEDWIRRESGYGTQEILQENGQPLETAYVVTCANKTHPVPKHARMIEPLQILSRSLADLAGSSTAATSLPITSQNQAIHEETASGGAASYPHDTSEPDECECTVRAHGLVGGRHRAGSHHERPSNRSSGSHGSGANSPISETGSIVSATEEKTNRLLRFLSWPTSPGKTVGEKPSRAPTIGVARGLRYRLYCFSSDEKSLLLWNTGGDHVYSSAIPNPISNGGWRLIRTEAPKLRFVSGGGDNVATISKV